MVGLDIVALPKSIRGVGTTRVPYFKHKTYNTMNTKKTSDEAKQRAANYMSLKGALESKLTIITTDIAGLIIAQATEGELEASASAPTIQEAQIKAVGNLLNLMAEAKGIEGVIICSQRAKIDMVKAKNTKANVYIAKLLNNTTHNVKTING